MTEQEEYLRIPGHVSAEEAARMLGLSTQRIYEHINAGHLPAKMVRGRYMIEERAVEDFKRNPPGRARKQPPRWRAYNSRINMLGTGIQVQVRPGQQEAFRKKLQVMREENLHPLTGTMQRYILEDERDPSTVHIWLVWKDNEMPDEEAHARELAAFKEELADVLDWETEQSSSLKGLLYT